MKSYNDICASGNTYLPTGAKIQCLEAVTVLLFLTKGDFTFDDIAAFRDKAVWETAIENKEIIPLFELYELASANTDETFYESRNFKKKTQSAAKVTTAELYLSICSDNALRSYANTEYSRVLEATEDGDVMGVYDDDGVQIQGQLLKDFTVGVRQPATTEKPPTTLVTITYNDADALSERGVITTPEFDPVMDLTGVYGVDFVTTGTPSATSITFKAYVGCANVNFAIETPDAWKVLKADGTESDATIAYDSVTEVYTATGTDMVSGTITTDGVQVDPVTSDFYEGSGPVVIV